MQQRSVLNLTMEVRYLERVKEKSWTLRSDEEIRIAQEKKTLFHDEKEKPNGTS